MGVIFPNKSHYIKSMTVRKIDFADFKGGVRTDIDTSILPMQYATKCYNFSHKKGVLESGLGLRPLQLPISNDSTSGEPSLTTQRTMVWDKDSNPVKMWRFQFYSNMVDARRDKVFVYSDDGKIHWANIVDTYVGYATLLLLFESKPNMLNYNNDGVDSALLSSPSDSLVIYTPGLAATTIENTPNFTSMCLHYERVFATTGGRKNSVWFSESTDPSNWEISSESGGYIEMADELGDCNRVLSFGSYIYIFRDFGITRLSAFAEQSSFSMSNIYTSSNTILGNTACICGNVVIFLTTDGLYSFDGGSVDKLELGYEGIFNGVDNTHAEATYHKNKYCLICNTNYATVSNNSECNTLYELDTETGDSELLFGYRFLSISSIFQDIMEKLVVIVAGNDSNTIYEVVTGSGQIDANPTTKVWKSAMTDLGLPSATKNIRAITVIARGSIVIKVSTDRETREFTLASDGVLPSRIRIGMSGIMLGIEFIANSSDVLISHPIVEYSYC